MNSHYYNNIQADKNVSLNTTSVEENIKYV